MSIHPCISHVFHSNLFLWSFDFITAVEFTNFFLEHLLTHSLTHSAFFSHLQIDLVPHRFGSASFKINMIDSGGTDNGGIDTSVDQSFHLTVVAVNDVPSFHFLSNVVQVRLIGHDL